MDHYREGRNATLPEIQAALKARREVARRRRAIAARHDEPEKGEELSWKDQLIRRILEIPPAGFERLAQRILREAGFVNVTVTGRSGDGGIDGMGVYR